MSIRFFESQATGVVLIALERGDLLLESIRQVAREADIHTGVVMTGIGGLSYGRIHLITTNTVPAQNGFLELPGPLEIVGFRGVIANYEPHLHISVMDVANKMVGGHLEPGCVVQPLSEISILKVPDLKLIRRKREGSPTLLLDIE